MTLHGELRLYVQRDEHLDICKEWWGKLDTKGRGQAYYKGVYWVAPRLAMHFFLKRPLKKDEHVLHSCNNPKCVNPKHLRLGTASENMQQMIKEGRGKGQFTKGRSPNSKKYLGGKPCQ